MKELQHHTPYWIRHLPEISGLRALPAPWNKEDERGSAVFMLFCAPESGSETPQVLFIRRSAQLRSHSGQIGFPGGRRDPEDFDPLATALRETEEELGILPAHITAMGALDPVYSLEGHHVWPIVGYTTLTIGEMRLNYDEVAEAFSVSWRDICKNNYQSFSFTLFGTRRTSHLFSTSHARIWGLTAQMLKNAEIADQA